MRVIHERDEQRAWFTRGQIPGRLRDVMVPPDTAQLDAVVDNMSDGSALPPYPVLPNFLLLEVHPFLFPVKFLSLPYLREEEKEAHHL